MRIINAVAAVLFVIALPGVPLSAAFAGVANSQWLYEHSFEKYGVSQTTGLSESELSKAASGLISYFNSDEEYISITVAKDGRPFTLFNEREVMHLKDVKRLIQLDYKVLAITLAYVLAFTGVYIWKRKWRGLAKAGMGGSVLTIVLTLVLGMASLLNFDQFFLRLHFLSFANELWQLDPSRDYLIMLFPEGFFYEGALIIGGVSAAVAITIGAVSWRAIRKHGRESP